MLAPLPAKCKPLFDSLDFRTPVRYCCRTDVRHRIRNPPAALGATHAAPGPPASRRAQDRNSTRLNSSHQTNSYAVFRLTKKMNTKPLNTKHQITSYVVLRF